MTVRRRYYSLIVGLLVFSNGSLTAHGQEVLAPGRVAQEELTAGQTHSYLIVVTEGQYVRVTFEAMHIRVVASMIGPDGEKLIENSAGAFPSWLSTIARMSGSYRIEVKRAGGNAKGTYSINVEELRAATSKDEDRMAAERAVIEGRRMEPSQRIVKFRDALERWRRAGDRKGEAEGLWFCGNVNREMADLEKARECYSQALGLASEIGHDRLEGQMLVLLGQVNSELGDWQASLDCYYRALDASKRTANRTLQGWVLSLLGGGL